MPGGTAVPYRLVGLPGAIGGAIEFEEFLLPELKGLGDQVGRKQFDQDIEVAHGTVVIPTRQLYLLINLGQVFLKLDKGPVGL